MNQIAACVSASERISLVAEQSESSILALFWADPWIGLAAVLTGMGWTISWYGIIIINDEMRKEHWLWESFGEWFRMEKIGTLLSKDMPL